jgi:hypothetical protein
MIEKSEKRGAKGMKFNTRKVVIANKADLKLTKSMLTKEDKDFIRDFGRYDVSAMTN